MKKQKIHPIWWLVGAVILVSVAPRMLSSAMPQDSLTRLAIMDENLDIVERYSTTVDRLSSLCVEDRETIIRMNMNVAEHWQQSDPEAMYLDALVTMSNVLWAKSIEPPEKTSCTEIYQGMMQVSRQFKL